jgi:alkanesulfonate monooxygenase SsuD/methylene tetrahydromethanopterin reductase-like flavin-dependent oxidoreductase (luciferase family)
MDFSVLFVPSTFHGTPERYPDVFAQVRLVEELGYDGVWFTEHHFSEYGRPAPTLMASHAAAITERVRIGIGVVVLPLHNPLSVAEEIATLDHLAAGRLQFGIGRGNQPEEFAGHGVSLDDAKARFDEGYEVMMGLWTNETFSYKGQFYEFPEVRMVPQLRDGSPPPMWQPAVSESSVRWVISKGINGLIGPYLTPFEKLRTQYFEPWHKMVAEAGGSSVRLGHNQFVHVAPTDEQAYEEAQEAAMWYARKASKLWGETDASKVSPQFAYMTEVLERFAKLTYEELLDMSLIGSPERVASRIADFQSWGVDELLVFNWFGPQMDQDRVTRSLRLFADEVMPQFKPAGSIARATA